MPSTNIHPSQKDALNIFPLGASVDSTADPVFNNWETFSIEGGFERARKCPNSILRLKEDVNSFLLKEYRSGKTVYRDDDLGVESLTLEEFSRWV